MSKTHKRLAEEVFNEVFRFILSVAAHKGLFWAKPIGIDSTTIQANSSMAQKVWKGSGRGWKDYTKKLTKQTGIKDPTDNEFHQYDRNRPRKKVSNDGELAERSFAHASNTGEAALTRLRGLASVTKRHLMMVVSRSLSTIMRAFIRIVDPRSLQELRALLQTAWVHFEHLLSAIDRMVAALIAPMAQWSRSIGG